mmetsp:Transcript_16720/g.30853  ORF Transcript_16720/g.30853 Transcript_16720/m.30853 type:complete len:247 (-) Transcript_16720:10-750(-)
MLTHTNSESEAEAHDMSARPSNTVGAGLGVYGGSWGAAPYKHHPWLPAAQVSAAVLMFWPLLTACLAFWMRGCTRHASCSIETILSWILVMPMSIANHLGHAAIRRWVPVLQKLDRMTIALGSVVGSWALSQNLWFTAGSLLLSGAVIALMWISPRRYRDSEILGTCGVAIAILYGLIPMLVFRPAYDPNFLPAAAAIISGFALFQLDPFGVWTDAVWHGLLGIYTYYCTLSAAGMDHRLFGQCVS